MRIETSLRYISPVLKIKESTYQLKVFVYSLSYIIIFNFFLVFP